ncbi:hypothetical protein [Nonomuraea salmonea]|uniref:PE domain-containing protein n=1 Tax=Nonomuraea salmonea TaxID=46181 RepID=A0ABV5NQ88_9ACTN
MAEEFSANRLEAASVARDLKAIRAALDGGPAQAQPTGSPKADAALRCFVAESSDNRERMDQLLERAAGLLDALVTGTGELDGALALADRPAPQAPAGVVVEQAHG